MRNGPRARALMAEWAAAMRDRRALTDQPNQCGLPNLADSSSIATISRR